VNCEFSLSPGAERDAAQDFGNVFDTYHARIYRYLWSLVGNADQAEDLAQDTFVKAYKALRRGSAPENVNAWLYAIATNTAFSALRRRRLIEWLPIPGNREVERKVGQGDHAARTGERELIFQALSTLPKGDAACLLLRFQQSLSYAELAEVLGTSVPAAKMRLSRARAAFREAYLRLGQEA
jgi:RNA polymerase sigma-70 factor, ECF subfamily